MKKGISVTGYLSKAVANKTEKLAKETRRHFFRTIKEAGGSLTKFDVTNGQIFIELRDEKGLEDLRSALSSLKDVKLEEVSSIELVFLKSQALADQKAQ